MKQSPEDQIVTERMQPGVYSRDGFLGSDRRPLGEIIDSDRSAVEQLATTNEAIAAKLQEALSKAMATYGTPVQIAEDLTAECYESRGKIPSTFGDGVFQKGEVKIGDSRTGRSIYISPLSVHMIQAQGFYGGRGSRYRVEPSHVCEMFGIRPQPQEH